MPSYEAELAKFEELNTQVLGISVDHIPCLVAWAESLGNITFPLLSDFWPHGAVAQKYGVLRNDGTTERAIFIIDEKGIIQYIDIHDIDDQPSNEVLFAELSRITGRPIPSETHGKEQQKEVDLPNSGTIMYCNAWCPDCKKARAWLAENKIEYTEVDVMKTAGAAAQVREWTGGDLVTPTFNINGTIVIDFDEAKLSEVLNIK